MKWNIEFIKEAQRDLKKLDPHNRRLILKAIDKTAMHPLPPPNGIGKPLGNNTSSNLSGHYKIKLRDLGYRVVYGLVRENNIMKIIVISIRDDNAVYKEAERRIQNLLVGSDLNAEIKKGINDMKAGRMVSAKEVKENMEQMFNKDN